MKTIKQSLLLAALLFSVGAMAQYQLPNPGFEQWDDNSVTAEPVHWNSFATSTGSLSSFASSPHHYHRNGGRPGTTGSCYLTIYSKSIMGVVANGNMTTGRINAGSMTPSSSENYNFTQRDNSAHCQPFSGTPDSMYVWVSFYAANVASMAQIGAIVHGNNDFRSPNYESDPNMYCGKAQARFGRTTSSATAMSWQQIKVPFVYDGNASPSYILVNMTTNFTAASGAANDSLSIDDIEFIYSAWLNGITVDGVTVADFSKGQFNYSVTLADTAALATATVAATTEVNDATVNITTVRLTDSTAVATIDVTAEDSVTTKQYTVTLNAPMPSPVTPDTVWYTVIVLANDSTRGSVTGSGLYAEGSEVTIEATPTGMYVFEKWNDDVEDNPRTITVTSDTTFTAIFSVHDGIERLEFSDANLYPNPTTSKLTVDVEGQVSLCDIQGRELMTACGPTVLDLGDLPSGIYLLHCKGSVQRVMKQ